MNSNNSRQYGNNYSNRQNTNTSNSGQYGNTNNSEQNRRNNTEPMEIDNLQQETNFTKKASTTAYP